MNTVRIGHSPDPDDAFLFYGFASGAVTIPDHEIIHVVQDIQTLNAACTSGIQLEVSAMSLHAYFGVMNTYELLNVGTSVGRRYGPRLVSKTALPLSQIHGKRVALPGNKTTAWLVARKLLPQICPVHMNFLEIEDAIRTGMVDAGVLIHEGQLTYQDRGLYLVADLGEMFASMHGGLPLPLGVNCIRRDLPDALKHDVALGFERSLKYALANRNEAIDYSLQFARGLSRSRVDTFVRMYVNEDSISFNQDTLESVEILRTQYWNSHQESFG